MTSFMLPGATRRTRGLPRASVNAWIAVVRPTARAPDRFDEGPPFPRGSSFSRPTPSCSLPRESYDRGGTER